jgi:hypothetical protein
MFEQLGQAREPDRIVVQTRLGHDIKNEIRPVSQHSAHLAETRYLAYRAKFGDNWIPRKPCCGGYNCFGMLFASRRTGIFDDEEVESIFGDDGYRRIDDLREVCVGDIAIYRTRPSGAIAHGGRVVSMVPGEPIPRIWVLSKWNLGWGEDVHPIGEIPIDEQHRSWEIWTEKEDTGNDQQAGVGAIVLP